MSSLDGGELVANAVADCVLSLGDEARFEGRQPALGRNIWQKQDPHGVLLGEP